MTLNEKIALLAQTIETDANKITAATKLSDINEWDSFAMILVISMLDKKFGCRLTRDDIEAFTTVQDILDRMDDKTK